MSKRQDTAYDAAIDNNKYPGLTAHSGTTDQAQTRKVVAVNGALMVAGAADILPTLGGNPETQLFYDASNLVGTVRKIIDGGTYDKTLSYDANNLVGTVSAWTLLT